jgi:membrane-associated phospholipid phosphatase
VELARRAPGALGRAGPLIACAAGFCVTAGLVASGALTGLDQYAVDHWMPWLSPRPTSSGLDLTGLYQPFDWSSSAWETLLEVWTYPASVLVSGLVFAAGCTLLARAGRRYAAAVWAFTWVAANGAEVVGKSLLERGALYGTAGAERLHVSGFDYAFPSGHSARAIVVAGLVGYLWPRLGLPAAVWAALVLPALVVSAAHVPSDVVGGTFLGVLAVLAARAASDLRLRRR